MMSDIQTFKLAGITCRFVDYRRNSSFNNWRWKLDPYRVPDTLERDTADVTPINITEAIPSGNSTCSVDSTCHGDSPCPGTLISEDRAGFYLHRLYDRGNDNLRWQYEDGKSAEPLLAYDLSLRDNKVTLICDHTSTGGTLAIEYLGRVLVPLLLKQNLLTFHGVLLEENGQGIILSAPSGTGKTTHARLWRDYKDALILNGDRASVKKEQGIWQGYGLPWSGTSGEQINRKVPLKAFVLLERGPENTAQRLEGLEAFTAMLTHVQTPAWHHELSEKAIDLVMALSTELPVIRLTCTPDREAVDVLYDALWKSSPD